MIRTFGTLVHSHPLSLSSRSVMPLHPVRLAQPNGRICQGSQVGIASTCRPLAAKHVAQSRHHHPFSPKHHRHQHQAIQQP